MLCETFARLSQDECSQSPVYYVFLRDGLRGKRDYRHENKC